MVFTSSISEISLDWILVYTMLQM